MASFHTDPDALFDYDVYPKVFAAKQMHELRIRPLGGRKHFVPGQSYFATFTAMDGGSPAHFPGAAWSGTQRVTATDEGGFAFPCELPSEQEYTLTFSGEDGVPLYRFRLYCVADDLIGRYPFAGDTHLHTTYSDGRQTPEVVCANYRRHGYDFLAITDHRVYQGSLAAIDFCRRVPTELTVCPGEEVQLPGVNGLSNDAHIINFGGTYSVNALMEREDTAHAVYSSSERSMDGACPAVMTRAEYDALMQKRCAEMTVPEGVDRFPAASCKWICEEIRKSGGLCILAHPNWIINAYHLPERFTDYLVEDQLFDAFEVLGGENYYEQNGFQTLRYYNDRARGCRYPVVGATDSHSSYPTNEDAFICSTVVFARENTREDLIASIKGFYSVAVDTISKEFRLVGEPRLARYTCFLLKNFFPLHDALCFEEGRLMKEAATGTPEEQAEAIRLLGVICGRVARQRKKYFAF